MLWFRRLAMSRRSATELSFFAEGILGLGNGRAEYLGFPLQIFSLAEVGAMGFGGPASSTGRSVSHWL